jgi:endonuclease/exonuclease/phosphatase family metal-dependent hydrolase
MPAPFRRTLAGLVAAATAAALAVPAGASGAADPRTNPTGTRAGSEPNGSSYLKLSLETTADGRVRVSWTRPSAPSRIRYYVVRVGINRSLDAKVRRYQVNRAKQSIVVPRAFGATSSSGNFTFVKITVRHRNGTSGSSPTKWIQTPLAAGCPVGTDRATIGTFNVRTWGGDNRIPRRFSWTHRGPRVVHEILRSGAHAVSVQEASGRAGVGYGRLRQNRWIIARLNAADPGAHWVDARSDDTYAGDGLVGTRVLYDANAFRRLDGGLVRIPYPHMQAAYAPWVRLQATDGATSPFVLISTHLANGNQRRFVRARNSQIKPIIALAKQLRDRFGGQVILGGDLNSTVDSKPYNTVQTALLHAGFYDSFATADVRHSNYATTNSFDFPVPPSPHRRDYIMTLGDAQGSCRYVNLAYRHASRAASDHFMQVATVPLSG